MVSCQASFFENKVAFHIYLVTGRLNSLVSTFPPEILKKLFHRELYHIENSLIVNQKMADRLLDEFSELILQKKEMQTYFYPSYLFNSGVNFKTAEQIIHLQDNFELKSGICFSERLNPIEFFHIQQRFSMSKSYILRTARYFTFDEFRVKYLTTDTSKFCFRSYANNCGYLLEFEDEDVECGLILNEEYQLKMFVSI